MVMGLGLLFSRLGLNHAPRAAQMEAMPQHDPLPPPPADSRRDPRDLERAHRAWLHYRKTMRWMVLVSVAAALLALVYLKATGTPMKVHLVIATLAGVFLSPRAGGTPMKAPRATATPAGVFLPVLRGPGLMGLVCASKAGGQDDAATGGDKRPCPGNAASRSSGSCRGPATSTPTAISS